MSKALGHLKSRVVATKADREPKKHTVTLVPGDTVGEELAEAVVQVVAATGVSLGWDRQIGGQKAHARLGTSLPDDLIESIRKNHVALKGHFTTPLGISPAQEAPSVKLRKILDLFASVRPARNLKGMPSRYEGVDLVVIRESTEDLYAGIEHEIVPGVVESLKVVTEAASTRIARFAFEYAARHARRSVTAVHKANIMKMSDGLFLDCCRRVASEFPAIAYRELIADNCIMQLVLDPRSCDVLVMGNMLGDIISDVCAGLTGGPGTMPGINVGPDVIVFEAIHGNAPHLMGRDLANPLTMLIPAVAMLRHLGEDAAADRIMSGIETVLLSRETLTPDLGGTARTSEMVAAIVRAMGAGG